MLVNFEQNCMVWTILYFWQKMVNHFWQNVPPFLKMFLWLKQLFDDKLSIQSLSTFSIQKLRYPDMCNQLKSWTKHVRPYRSKQKQTVTLKIETANSNTAEDLLHGDMLISHKNISTLTLFGNVYIWHYTKIIRNVTSKFAKA